jgi:Putative Ig domain
MSASFGLTRLSPGEAIAFLLPQIPLPQEIGGASLFVYHGIPDTRLFGDNGISLPVPADAFAHTDPTAIVHLEARLEDGSPLPAWLRFDGMRGVFTGFPPVGSDEALGIEIVARDTAGREARTHFTLEIAALRNAAAAGIGLGMDVDKEELEKARREAARQARGGQPAAAGVRPAKPGAASFSDQVSAARTQRDPLLDLITSPDKAKPRARR